MKNLKNWKEKSDNRGFSFVLVVVALGVVSLLIATILMVAYQNYQMKVTGLQSEDNFYSAEQVVDEIKAGLQGDMSEAVSEAYDYVLEHYSETEGQDGTRNWYFQTQYVDNLYQKLQKAGTQGVYDLTHLGSYVIKGSQGEVTALTPAEDQSDNMFIAEYDNGSRVEISCSVANEAAAVDEEGALVTGTKSLQFHYKNGVTIKGLTVSFTNEKGLSSVVNTDLVLGIPSINFTQTIDAPDLLSYCIIADNGIDVPQNGGSRSTLDGNVYAGSVSIDYSKLTVNAKNYFVVKDGITVKNNGIQSNNAGLVKNNDENLISESGMIWTDGFILDGATMSLDGDVYVRDDLTLNGANSMVSVSGKYMGYSNPEVLHEQTNHAAKSSAIIVNGRNSVLDFRSLEELLLAGNGYVNIGSVTASQTNATGYFNSSTTSNSVRMGESLAIKSNQLAYLAPVSTIRVTNGTIEESGNPMIVKPDQDENGNNKTIDTHLNTQIALKELGGKTLRQLDIASGDCQQYIVQKANTDGTINVYVYLDLSEEQAAKYFAARYDNQLKGYAKIFLPSLASGDALQQVFNNNAEKLDRLELNGNITNAAAHNMNKSYVTQELDGYQKVFQALCKKLIMSYSSLTDDEKEEEATVFTNIVQAQKSGNAYQYASKYGLIFNGGMYTFRTPVTELDAVIVDGNYVIDNDNTDGNDDSDVRLVLATGNVRVERNFKGLIICGGKVTIANGASVTAVPEETAAVFQCIYNASGETKTYNDKTVSPMTFFKEGEQYLLNGIASGFVSGSLGDQINLIDYIRFENWKKQ